MISFIISLLLGLNSVNVSSDSSENNYIDSGIHTGIPVNVTENNIVGSWRIESMWEDYGMKIRRVTFDPYGIVTYIPSYERQDSRVFSGAYWIDTDTIKIKFNDQKFFEFYKYRIIDDKLYLLKLGEYFNDECLLNNLRRENVWERAVE